jgi:outer membrane protein assembly factor BamD (BamD/ComL family)
MSIAGIGSTDLYSAQSVQSQMQQMRQEFQQLGSDLQSGNLSAAQSDFATLTQLDPNLASSSSTSSTSSTAAATSSTASNPMQQAFAQLAQDLKSGNLSAAQQDFSTIQQAMQSASAAHGHHHHHHSESSSESSSENPISQLFSQLGQDLQSGNLTAAQQDFTSLQQQFQQNAQNNLQVPPEVGPNAVSVTA